MKKFILFKDNLPDLNAAIYSSSSKADIEQEIVRLQALQEARNQRADEILLTPLADRKRGWSMLSTKTNHVWSFKEIEL